MITGNRGEGRAPAGASRPSRFSTATITHDGLIVPWLAADGPLAYSPEKPPDRDYYFQYGWILPGIFADHTNTRRHFYFGASVKDHDTGKLFDFWKKARNGVVERVAYCAGVIDEETVISPVAVYRGAPDWRGRPTYLIMQHGSYQILPAADQPLIEAGEVMLYRGVQRSRKFRFPRLGTRDPARRQTWRRYVEVQAYVLSDAVRSFNSIHDRASRSETGYIRDRSWVTGISSSQTLPGSTRVSVKWPSITLPSSSPSWPSAKSARSAASSAASGSSRAASPPRSAAISASSVST